MSRLQRLIRVLACRTGLRTGNGVRTTGDLPLTGQGTFGGFPLPDYGVYGAARVNGTPTPGTPAEPSFVGEATLPDGTAALSLVFTAAGPDGTADRRTATFPGVEPLRAASGVSDEICFKDGKLIRRIGVCTDPVPQSGLDTSYGSGYPSVGMLIGDGTTVPDAPHLLSTHWREVRSSNLIFGTDVGMAMRLGMIYVNLPRSLYRKYVKGCVGETEESGDALLPSVDPGTYRCDFFDGTSRVFTLTSPMNGVEYCRDVLAVSRSGAVLKRKTALYAFTGEEEPTVRTNYGSTGKTLFLFDKEDFDADPDGDEPLSSHFLYADTTPTKMIRNYANTPAFCDDGDLWYFYVPGVSTLADFQAYLSDLAETEEPATLVYPVAEPDEITLSSYAADTGTVSTVPLLPGITDDEAFDGEDGLTLIPAMREFLADERNAGREVRFYYVLPAAEVTETALTLPVLHAGEGSTTFTAASAEPGGVAPVSGYFTALAEDTP